MENKQRHYRISSMAPSLRDCYIIEKWLEASEAYQWLTVTHLRWRYRRRINARAKNNSQLPLVKFRWHILRTKSAMRLEISGRRFPVKELYCKKMESKRVHLEGEKGMAPLPDFFLFFLYSLLKNDIFLPLPPSNLTEKMDGREKLRLSQ